MTADKFEVYYTQEARNDLLRLFEFLLAHARSAEDFDDAQSTIDTITHEIEGQLSRAPFIFRKAGQSPFIRELIIPCRKVGYVALYEIERDAKVNILAVRHQLENDYH